MTTGCRLLNRLRLPRALPGRLPPFAYILFFTFSRTRLSFASATSFAASKHNHVTDVERGA